MSMRPRLSTAVLVVSAQLAGLPAVGQTAWPAPPKPPAPAWPQAPGSASAPAPAPVTAQTMPANAAELDTLLATKQYAQIGQIMRQASTPTAVTINLNWQREKVFAGASAFVAFTYANDLWRMAEVIPPEHGAELKNTAVVAALYTVALIAIDGVKCQ
ncbi:MAG TPA: hypothetical protein VJL90_09795, partial [Pseudorhodoplanes sp.]|nr:hypothetical protein [Pseudorhodoplanes sp.]